MAAIGDDKSRHTPGSDGPETFSITSLSLLDRARGRDAAAWQRLVALYSPLVASWCRRSGLKAEDASDLVQDVFASVSGRLSVFQRDGTGGTFRGWLRVITRNKISDHFRRRSEEPDAAGGSTARMRLEQIAGPDFDDSEADQDEVAGVFSRALESVRNEFEQKTWQAFWLTAVENRPPVDVAASLEMTAGAVRQAKYKILRRLRAELGDVLEWPESRSSSDDAPV